MITTGVINGQLASLLARFRHVNTIAIVDGPFPTYPNVETVDLALVMGVPTIPQVLDAILPLLDEHAASNNEAAPKVATARMRRREMRLVIDISPLVGGLAHIGCGQEYSSRN